MKYKYTVVKQGYKAFFDPNLNANLFKEQLLVLLQEILLLPDF